MSVSVNWSMVDRDGEDETDGVDATGGARVGSEDNADVGDWGDDALKVRDFRRGGGDRSCSGSGGKMVVDLEVKKSKSRSSNEADVSVVAFGSPACSCSFAFSFPCILPPSPSPSSGTPFSGPSSFNSESEGADAG